jgi:CTP:phosphocholine cytidylyltransferase-like protein
LACWRQLQQGQKEEDIESGWCFIRNSDHETVVRDLDTRFMKEEYLQIFWNTLKNVRDKTVAEVENGHIEDF